MMERYIMNENPLVNNQNNLDNDLDTEPETELDSDSEHDLEPNDEKKMLNIINF